MDIRLLSMAIINNVMPTVFILQCEDGYYFIGQTRREYYADLDKHFKGEVHGWTQAHKPVRLELLRYFCDHQDADVYTRAYMYRYGIDKVRGGSYSDCVLSITQLQEIQRLQHIDYINCDKCGMQGHTKQKCPFPKLETVDLCQSTSLVVETQGPQHANDRATSNRTCWNGFLGRLYQTIRNLWHQRNVDPDLFYSLYTHH